MLTGNDLDSKSANVEEKLNSLAKVEEKLKRQEEVNDKKLMNFVSKNKIYLTEIHYCLLQN